MLKFRGDLNFTFGKTVCIWLLCWCFLWLGQTFSYKYIGFWHVPTLFFDANKYRLKVDFSLKNHYDLYPHAKSLWFYYCFIIGKFPPWTGLELPRWHFLRVGYHYQYRRRFIMVMLLAFGKLIGPWLKWRFRGFAFCWNTNSNRFWVFHNLNSCDYLDFALRYFNWSFCRHFYLKTSSPSRIPCFYHGPFIFCFFQWLRRR